MRKILTLAIIMTTSLTAFSQDVKKAETESQSLDETYSYAYFSVQQMLLPTKLKVEVDFGDTPEQIDAGKEYSKTLTGRKSYAAILNYMGERQFELVSMVGLTYSYQGSGGGTGVTFVMRKKK